jgi:MFS family permease
MTHPPATQQRFAALHYRNFTLLWSGLIASNIGTWMQNVAVGWLILQLTNSALWLGLQGLSFAVPMIILPLVGGAVADRVNRIKLLYFTQSGPMVIAFILAVLTWSDNIQPWHLLVATFLGGCFLAFDNPSRQALIPDMVERKDLLNALSLNSATYTGAALVGPALAGALLVPLGAGWLFFINGVSFLAVIFALAAMRGVHPHAGNPPLPIAKAILSGLGYAWHDRGILALLVLSAVAGVFGRSYQNLLPAFARDIWNSGEVGYGLLLSAAGGGALIGAIGLAALKELKQQRLVMIVSGLLFGVSVLAFALSPNLALGILFMFLAGVLSTIFGTIIATFIQMAAPKELRGRLMSLYAITLIGLPSLGALASGAIAEKLGGLQGAPRAVALGAVILIIILVVTTVFDRRVISQPAVSASKNDGPDQPIESKQSH